MSLHRGLRYHRPLAQESCCAGGSPMTDLQRPGPERPPQPADMPQTGGEILKEVERLKGQRTQFGCFGMSLGILVALLILVWLAWMYVTAQG